MNIGTSMVPTYRVQNIPATLCEAEILALFQRDQRQHLKVKSLSLSLRQSDMKVATIVWDAQANSSESNMASDSVSGTIPALMDTKSGVEVDNDFYGFTPLNDSNSPIVAE